MTSLQKDAIDLVKMMPDDKLYFIVEIMHGIAGIYDSGIDRIQKREAFDELESLCKSVPDLDDKREMREWREEKFGYEGID